MSRPPSPRISATAYQNLGRAAVPLAELLDIRTELLQYGHARLRLPWDEQLLRPGGVVSGPALFALTDMTMYGLVMSARGALEMAVTSDISIRFLRAARAGDVVADGYLLRIGRRLATCEVRMFTDGDERAVAHATGTYALPAC